MCFGRNMSLTKNWRTNWYVRLKYIYIYIYIYCRVQGVLRRWKNVRPQRCPQGCPQRCPQIAKKLKKQICSWNSPKSTKKLMFERVPRGVPTGVPKPQKIIKLVHHFQVRPLLAWKCFWRRFWIQHAKQKQPPNIQIRIVSTIYNSIIRFNSNKPGPSWAWPGLWTWARSPGLACLWPGPGLA